MEVWSKETTPGTTGSRCTIRDETGLFVAECIASDAARIVEAPAMVEALRWALSMAEEAILVRENGDDPEDTPDICEMHRAELERHRAILSRIDGAGDTLPDAPALTATCPHCGRDNTGHEVEPCADDCPQYWEGQGRAHPEHPTGESQVRYVSTIIRRNAEPRFAVFDSEKDLADDLREYARDVLDLEVSDLDGIAELADSIGEETRENVYWGEC